MAPAGSVPPPSDPSSWKLPQLRITRDGAWLHDGEEVTHPGILESLRSGLRVDEQGHYLEIGSVRVPVEVDDAPFVVVRVEPEGERLMMTLDDLSREPLAVDTLSVDQAGIPYCRVKGGCFLARLSRAATYQLLDRVEMDDRGEVVNLVLGRARHPIPGPWARPSTGQ